MENLLELCIRMITILSHVLNVVSVFQMIKLTMRTLFLNAMQKICLIVFHVWGVLLQGGRGI